MRDACPDCRVLTSSAPDPCPECEYKRRRYDAIVHQLRSQPYEWSKADAEEEAWNKVYR